jgi:hypothetical protein
MALIYKHRQRHIEQMMREPHRLQESLRQSLLYSAEQTEWGKQYQFKDIRSADAFAQRLPVQDYEAFKPDIERMMRGEKDVLWHGQTKWFSKSSGTTNDKSKYIPITKENLKDCHIKGTWDTMTMMYHHNPNSQCFRDKTVLMGGSHYAFDAFPETRIGDVSAIMIEHMPRIARPFFTPDFETALLPNFEEKLNRLVELLPKERLVMLGGVPTWTVVLFNKILEHTGKNNLLEIWPDLEAYVHGGVSFSPYREQFKAFIPKADFVYQEIYNASEGFFAIQNDMNEDGMLLLVDNGVYYEFVPFEYWNTEFPRTIGLADVEKGKHYALVITTNSGLWRYMTGDTVMFTSTMPYKIKITGRTKQFVNAFGEEVMVANTDQALEDTCKTLNVAVSEYTVAPIYFSGKGKGGHEWLIEFDRQPADLEQFKTVLDQNLQRINSDYEAKRHKNIALDRLCARILPKGTFHHWLRSKGKFGGQNKVPRLANHRQYVDDILLFVGQGV